MKNSEEIAGFLEFLKGVPFEYSASLHVQQSCEEDAQRLLSALERNKLDSESKERIEQKIIQPLNDYTCRFRPSSLKCTDKSGLDGLQADKQIGV